ncbi:hypothetical protein [Segatella copri]|uniref:hypothetical protein n=1 Tax=Segatella copri TaxID=165179 RepID=UPI003F88C477
MKKIEIITLKALRKIFGKLFGSKSSTYDRGITDPEKASELIYNLLASGKPCMIARYGAFELATVINYLGVKNTQHSCLKYITGHELQWWWNKRLMGFMQSNAGFFPSTEENLMKFGEMMVEDSKQLDILGSWLPDEKVLKKTFNLGYQDVFLRNLEPFWSKQPWTSYLEGKRVVVVHPFAESIKNQYDNYRDKIFENSMVLPNFTSLRVIKAVQSLGGNSEFKDWFEALDYMKGKIDQEDYDVCLIGCGAYGFPLAAHVKRMGKQAIHLGGALQLLFGIRGNRWDNLDEYKSLVNQYWTRPKGDEIPQAKDKVENGCYW